MLRLCSRAPILNLTVESAREFLDAEGLLGDVVDKDILCLASGGGQQSAAFALLGANVTVFDLSEAQLERDRQAAAHYRNTIRTVQGDMRDLSALAPACFDLVYQPFSIGYVPDARVVFAQVARVLRPGGMYFLAGDNPFFCGMSATDWNGEGYVLKAPYVDTAPYVSPDPDWVYARSNKPLPDVRESRLYRHTLANTLNSLFSLGFALLHVSDSKHIYPDPNAEPGTWDHFVAYAPVYLEVLAALSTGFVRAVPACAAGPPIPTVPASKFRSSEFCSFHLFAIIVNFCANLLIV